MDIIKLLKSYINKEQLNMDISDSDIKLLKEQSLQTLLYPLTNNKGRKKTISKEKKSIKSIIFYPRNEI